MQKTNVSGVILLIMTLCLASCGGPKGNQVKLSLNLGAIVSSQATAGGGMIYGRLTGGGEQWGMALAQGAAGVDKTLNNGSWEFHILIWEGPGIFEGPVRCGTAAANLDGAAADVSLNVSVANCNTAQFADASYHDASYGFLPLRLVSCNNFVKVTNGSSVCDHPSVDMGNSKSFKIQMRGSESGDLSDGHWSRCLTHAGLVNHRKNDSTYFSDIRLPVGAAFPFPVTIHGFMDENCTEEFRPYPFPQGLGGPGNLVAAASYTATYGADPLDKIDYQLWLTTNPFSGSGSGIYSTTPSSDLTFSRVIYSYSSGYGYDYDSGSGPSCDTTAVSLSGLPGGYMGNKNCPQTQDWTCTGTQCTGGGYEPPHCKSDYSNSKGPNCDSGYVTAVTINCNKDYYPNIECTQTNDVRYCGGSASCGWNGGANPAPIYSSLYLIDNEFGVGNSALTAQGIEIQCTVGSGTGFQGCFSGLKDHEKGMEYDHEGGMGVQNKYSEFYQIQSDLFGLDDPDMEHSDGHRELGTIGYLRADLMGAGVGGILYRAGYTDCTSIPTSGSLAMPMYSPEDGGSITLSMQFGPGQKIMPSWAGTGSGSGVPFEKRVTLDVNGMPDVVMEFNCLSNLKSGYKYDFHQSTEDYSEKETYYRINSPTDTQFETAGYSSGTWGGNLSIRHSLQGFKKSSSSNFQLWSTEVSRWDESMGTGSGESWHAQNIMATGSRTKVRLATFEGNRDGDITLPKAASAYIGGVPLRIDASGVGAAYNGMKISIFGSGTGTGTMTGSGSGSNPNLRWLTGRFDGMGSGSSDRSTYQDIISAFNSYQGDFTMAWDVSDTSGGYGSSYGSGGPSSNYYSNNDGFVGNHLYLSGGKNANQIMSTDGNFRISYYTQYPSVSYINNSDPHDDFYQGLQIFAPAGNPGWITNRYGNHCNGNGSYTYNSGSGTPFQVVGVVGTGFSGGTSYNLGMSENSFATLNNLVGTGVVEIVLSGSGTGGAGTGYGMEYIQKGMLFGPTSGGSGLGTVIENSGPNKFRVWVHSGSFSGGQTFTASFYDMSMSGSGGPGSGSGGSGSGGGGNLMNITDLAVGASHVCALVGSGSGSGNVFCWGDNSSGQLGNGSGGPQSIPTQVTGLANVIDIAAGNLHTCALQGTGSVQCWGSNGDYELGDGTTTIRTNPVAVVGLSGVVAISAGGATNCALTGAGAVQCWGYNMSGQLGDGTNSPLNGLASVVGLGSGVSAIASSTETNCALLNSGTVQCWGNGVFGQIGTGGGFDDSWTPATVTGLSNITSIGLGGSHACAISNTGSVTCWGKNSSAQLGTGSGSDSDMPNVPVSGIGSGMGLALGATHTCALDNGTLKCWGYNFYGMLGDGTTTDKVTPTMVTGLNGSVTKVVATEFNTCAILGSTEVQCWGDNAYAQLGVGSGGGISNQPMMVYSPGGGGGGSGSGSGGSGGGGGTVITYNITSAGSGTGAGYAIDCFDPTTKKWTDDCTGLSVDNANIYGQVHWPNGSGAAGGVQFSPDWVLQNITPGALRP
ncbi:MAG: hypothetical protein A2X86_02590 [Bdellovibrionales bacterium GWA2_49_15]|nr:MAG: hypothetical protein A2X86_02590 [Bdellovibrionales bacterium GWA2_49_15]